MMALAMPKQKESQTEFGQKLSFFRKQKGMTQIDLAKAIDSTQRAISSYETGLSYPPLPVMAGLAKALKVSVDELLGIKNTSGTKQDLDPDTSRLWKKVQKISSLPEKDQRAIIRMINSLAATQQKMAS